MKKNVREGGSKILIVDDDKNVRSFLERFLKQKGYLDIHTAAGGKEALNIIRGEKIKLVLLDIKLPDKDGVEVLREMKGISKDINVIMITAFPDEDIAKKAMGDGACDYIVKPFDLAYLESSVHSKIAMFT